MRRRGFLKGVGAGVVATTLAPYTSFSQMADDPRTGFGWRTFDGIFVNPHKKLIWIDDLRFTGNDVYSMCKEIWYEDTEMIKYSFPFIGITPEMYEIINGWYIMNPERLQSCSIIQRDAEGNIVEVWMGVRALGTYDKYDKDTFVYSVNGFPWTPFKYQNGRESHPNNRQYTGCRLPNECIRVPNNRLFHIEVGIQRDGEIYSRYSSEDAGMNLENGKEYPYIFVAPLIVKPEWE